MEHINNNKFDFKNWYERTWRWWVLGVLFLATFLNYFDRQTLGMAMDPIAEEFNLNNIQRGNLLAAFIFTYAFTHVFMGFIIDRIKNIRVFFPIMLLGWSISTLLVGQAKSYTTILWLRYLLGIWEAVNFPICLMIISRIFPAEERSLASGIFASGAFLATLAAPPVTIFFSVNYTWRYSFVFAGLLGIFWLIPWFIIFRYPEKRALNWTKDELSHSDKKNFRVFLTGFRTILKAPGFWAIAFIGLGIIPSLYFATQWFPSFFTQALNVPYENIKYKLMSIYFMQDVGLWIGGAIVLKLSKKGLAVLKSRKLVMTAAYLIMVTSILLATQIRSVTLVVVLLCIYVFGIGTFLGNQHAFKQDIDRKQVAAVAALVGFIETGFTAFVIKQIGFITNETNDFSPIFLLMAGLATFALIIVHTMLKPKWFDVH
jgi:ACS family hexuronate transporter-like MFS transporter